MTLTLLSLVNKNNFRKKCNFWNVYSYTYFTFTSTQLPDILSIIVINNFRNKEFDCLENLFLQEKIFYFCLIK